MCRAGWCLCRVARASWCSERRRCCCSCCCGSPAGHASTRHPTVARQLACRQPSHLTGRSPQAAAVSPASPPPFQ
eukprot:6411413-Alexandrium_andersonii.AAC.1